MKKPKDKEERIAAKWVKEITVVDPETGGPVDVAIYKLETGQMVGIDASVLNTDQDLYSPFDAAVQLSIED